MTSAEVAEKVQQAVASACRQHRRSILKAAEVLEMAGVGVQEDARTSQSSDVCPGPATVDEQLRSVHEAIEVAHRRHRISIAQAVAHTATGKESIPATDENAARAKVQKIVAAAYMRYNECRRRKGRCSVTRGAPALGAPLALMNARIEAERVHIGPAKLSAPPKRGVRARYGSA
eukprot:gnl/TRDRNA2_/TRDRNA2_158240_c2_seq1.p1 gnl/TRDRNA2_/TRDRNA2_158240_c2~~gnl/TRDRNA2_/TRDRNA2_158240_c2_seq1.p1  ORF type:complete len:175 (+),score=26.48 gnl/TRDRNA2_/TRDRNA2_158240_c2_seq1:2-526(+)